MSDDNRVLRTAIIAVGGLAAAVGAYVLIQKILRTQRAKLGPGVRIGDVTVEQMQELLAEVQESHDSMKTMMVNLRDMISGSDLSFLQICKVVEEMKPADPLARYGISLEEFSQLLAQFSGHESVRKSIVKLTAGPYQTDDSGKHLDSEKAEALTKKYSVEDVIAMHSYMLGQLRQVSDRITFEESVSPRVATIAAQAYIGTRLHEQWQVTADDLETLTSLLHAQLAEREEFFEVGAEMRQVVAQLVEKCSSQKKEAGDPEG